LCSLAIAFEIGSTACLRLGEVLARLIPSMLTLGFHALSFAVKGVVARRPTGSA